MSTAVKSFPKIRRCILFRGCATVAQDFWLSPEFVPRFFRILGTLSPLVRILKRKVGGTWAKFGANVDKIRKHDQRRRERRERERERERVRKRVRERHRESERERVR